MSTTTCKHPPQDWRKIVSTLVIVCGTCRTALGEECTMCSGDGIPSVGHNCAHCGGLGWVRYPEADAE